MRARGYNNGMEPVLYLDTGEQDMVPIESPLVTLLPYLRRLLLLTEVAECHQTDWSPSFQSTAFTQLSYCHLLCK